MKRLLIATVLFLGITACSMKGEAQTGSYPVQTPLVAGGDFNKGSGVTTVKNWGDSTGVLWTALDTAQLAAGAGDSASEKLVGEYHSVLVEVHATTYTGTSCDSVTVNIWGTGTRGTGEGSFKLLQTTTLAASTAEQVITYLPANGIGNPYTNYRTTVDVADLAGTCKTKWQAWICVR